ncbi:hypothetical protein C8R43DRAFT_1116119 [Mycena crocata]|nr:hypothetical protein C8R43DRAFT_1116119 [Mycena crocata]
MSTGPTFSFSTTADDVAAAFPEEIKGKNVLITGTSINGMGFEAARVIAKYANLVVITGYNDERLRLSEEAIKKDVPMANIRRLNLDLTSLADVRKAAAEVNAYPEALHVLINNAAAFGGSYRVTQDKFEIQMGVNHLGPFLFTKLIAPKLLASKTDTYTPRVVFVSSAAHAMCAGVDFDILEHPTAEGYNSTVAYWQSKSANVLTAIEISKRSKGALNAYSLNPGRASLAVVLVHIIPILIVVFTNMCQKEEGKAELQALGLLGADGQAVLNNRIMDWKTIPQGAATMVAAAFDPRIADRPGSYLDDAKVANESIAPHSSDPANGERLWALTEKLIGEKFTFSVS